jgi:hypothetical protein
MILILVFKIVHQYKTKTSFRKMAILISLKYSTEKLNCNLHPNTWVNINCLQTRFQEIHLIQENQMK